ncbi:MAG: hypothetical protein OEX07_08365 [Gammaproteobacteria bacterium]|nr:hypothetical protein [Gammaproteobacteria bacterium]
MKRIFIPIFLLSACSSIFAGERDSFFSSDIKHGGFGGPTIHFTEINGETNYLVGGQGAWLINQKYYLGGAGYGSIKDVEDTNEKLDYGGLLAGMKFDPLNKIHYSADILVGMGSLDDDSSNSNSSEDIFLVIEPGVYVNISLTRFAELDIGITYRYINGSDQQDMSDSDLSSVSIGASVMFGKF